MHMHSIALDRQKWLTFLLGNGEKTSLGRALTHAEYCRVLFLVVYGNSKYFFSKSWTRFVVEGN